MAIGAKVRAFIDKVSGTSRIDNGNDPSSAAYKMKQSMAKKVKFTPKPTSDGIGVGP